MSWRQGTISFPPNLFVNFLPRSRVSHIISGMGASPTAASMKENLILLVEDCSEDASLVLHAFKKWGITNRVQVVPDGEQAVNYLAGNGIYADRDAHPVPCLALLDLNLPQISGFEVLNWLRAQPELAQLPVVILSGTRDNKDFNRAHRLGANACVVKSNELGELHELIQHLDYFSLASDFNSSEVEWSPEL